MGAGLTVALAACGTDEQPAQPQTTAADRGQSGQDGQLVKASDVAVGSGVVTADGVLVMQLAEGEFTAFNAICPHQKWRVSPPDAQGVIVCSAHRSHFRAQDGTKIDGPAPGGLTPIRVQVKDGHVVRIT